jgi:hypothetical protein
MDAHGHSLHKDVEQESARELAAIGQQHPDGAPSAA